MEGKRKRAGRALRRSHECSRLQEQLWTRAFEEIWPLIRRLMQRQPAVCDEQKTKCQQMARSA